MPLIERKKVQLEGNGNRRKCASKKTEGPTSIKRTGHETGQVQGKKGSTTVEKKKRSSEKGSDNEKPWKRQKRKGGTRPFYFGLTKEKRAWVQLSEPDVRDRGKPTEKWKRTRNECSSPKGRNGNGDGEGTENGVFSENGVVGVDFDQTVERDRPAR